MRFENTKRGHEKWYEIKVVPGLNEEFIVFISWGKIGHTFKIQPIYKGDYQGAEKIVNEHIQIREQLGYERVQDTQ